MRKSKPVAQYSGKTLVAKYPSMALASELTGTQVAHIGKVAAGLRNTAGGFSWKTTARFSDSLTPKKPGITQLDKSGNVVAVYANTTIASELTGIKEAQINGALSGAKRSAGGYKWA